VGACDLLAFLCDDPVEELWFAHNRVVGCTRGVGPLADFQVADTTVITDNFIQSSTMPLTVMPVAGGTFYVRRNTVLGSALINCMSLSGHDTVASNIFSADSFLFASNRTLFFAYNNHVSGHADPLGIGINAMTNARGDSCDAFFNIVKKSLFADSTTGALLASSPCIGTGMDGENMGVYQGAGVSASISHQKAVHAVDKPEHFLSVRLNGNSLRLSMMWSKYAGREAGSISLYTSSGALVKKALLPAGVASFTCDVPAGSAGMLLAQVKLGNYERAFRVNAVK
jgi:hypothetical protein